MRMGTLKIIDNLYKVTKRAPFSSIVRLGEKIYSIKDNYIFDVLSSTESHDIYSLSAPKKYTDKVWVCWLQGEENAPTLVKKCIASIRKNCIDREVIILTDKNIKDYVTLPDWIFTKYHSGLISKTHFSDIVRMNLLAQQGGLWADATIFMTRPLSNEFFNERFMSLRNTTKSSHTFITGYWTSYFFYAPEGDQMVVNCANLLNNYLKVQEQMIDYFLLDYTITKTIYDLEMENTLSQTPILGNNRWLLHNQANKIAEAELLKQFEDDPVGIYKITYKVKYKQEINGKDTIFKKIFGEISI